MKDYRFTNGPVKFPEQIDFSSVTFNENPSKAECNSWILNLGYSAYNIGHLAFNLSPEFCSFYYFISRYYKIDNAIETGTHKGFTTRFLSQIFDSVYTIEGDSHYYQLSKTLLRDQTNIRFILGNSPTVLKTLLPVLKGNRLFCFLDAHWYKYWPLLDEIEEISKTHHDNCVIAIDDFKVPGRDDISYDKYGEFECSYEYVQEKLSKVFTAYDFHYLIPPKLSARAQFVAIPKKWKE